MGVNGLWTVIQPCARPTNLATLNRKRLAVDASIWIYQFLKAVRDKEGNALRNSHIVGFFRRICKLLWFGIQPVFVFDGGAPALKRATIQKRKQRREGRREDAIRTAGKLLAIQMQRLAEEEEEKRRRENERPRASRAEEAEEEIPDASNLVYVEEIGMSQQERLRNRKFYKQDAYHLPEIEGGIASMGKPDDPRIMSVEELEEYARQFNNGEDINLYDFSKIDFDGDFFKSLPPPDRYNILNAARLRSRLRMGLSKEQLDDMFPDRMAFSRFQIERVKERNHLTQRLMYEVGMLGTDLTLGVNARIAGERDREYILVKNEGVEGGWALGVVSKDKDVGEAHKPIDVDALQFHYQTKEEESEEEEDFEDVPIVGVNRLPKLSQSGVASLEAAQDMNGVRQQFYASHRQDVINNEDTNEDSLFVGGRLDPAENIPEEQSAGHMHPEEEHELNLAIALSLQNQHGVGRESEENVDGEDDIRDQPEWTQVAVEAPKPIGHSSGSMIAHIVNNRANAAVPKRQEAPVEEEKAKESDSDDDMQTVLAKSRKMKKSQPKPVFENKKNPFDGPLPFPKLDWGSSLFAKKKTQEEEPIVITAGGDGGQVDKEGEQEDGSGGGFEVEPQQEDGPKPLPPWMVDDDTDIREAIKKQQDVDREINAQDRAEAEEEENLRRRELRDKLIEIQSSDDDDDDGSDDVKIIEIPPSPEAAPISSPAKTDRIQEEDVMAEPPATEPAHEDGSKAESESPEPEFEEIPILETPSAPLPDASIPPSAEAQDRQDSPEPEFEDVQPADSTMAQGDPQADTFLIESLPLGQPPADGIADDDDLFADVDYDEFSDPEDEELLTQMAEEAEEHARFASELNKKSTQQNREDYERELRALRSQQKKDRRDADEVTQTMITECQALLRLFGIPYITAPMEAEAQCAELVRLGMVDGIVTDDSDTFLFGGTRVYKNMFNSNKFVECYVGTDLDKEMSLSREQLISLAQLLGSDYTEGLPGVGPVTAVEILSEFPGKDGLEKFREWWKEVQSQARPKEADASSSFRRKFRKSQATKLFLPLGFPSPAVCEAYLHPMVDSSTEQFQWGVPDVAGLREYLMATIGWSKERTDEVLVPVIRDMNKREIEGTQSNITRFFGGSVGAGARETFAPRQRVQGSKRMAAAVDRLRANMAGEEQVADAEEGSGANKRRKTDRRRRA
ncbi:hypothetical protein V8C35DRAFT_287019 [Trichoderma chlorosporum]